MIRLSCTNCRQVLTIDDAFAGGVCRCQHCGTIQTVPAATAGNEVAVGGPALGGGRNGASFGGAPHSGTGLDELAGAVVSSGLSSRRLTRPGPGGDVAAAPPARRNNAAPLLVGGGVVIATLVGLVIYLATRPPPAPQPTGEPIPTSQTPHADPAPASPTFCASPLVGDTVVYVLDRGSATQEVFPVLRDAALRSAASLGPGRHFQVVFWADGDNDTAAYPPTGTTYATPENVAAARTATDNVTAFGRKDVLPALTLALEQHPDTIVIATANGSLDADWAKAVLAARGASAARLDTFSLGNAAPPDDAGTPPLKAVATATGGTYVTVSDAELKTGAGE